MVQQGDMQQLEYAEGGKRADAMATTFPKALSAKYDRRIHRVVISFGGGLGVVFSPRDAEGLEKATPAQLDPIEISPSGFGLHFPRLDADLYLPALLEGVFGSERWLASRFGAKGGKVKSTAKTEAAKRNGQRGGRPRKTIAATA